MHKVCLAGWNRTLRTVGENSDKYLQNVNVQAAADVQFNVQEIEIILQ